MSEIHIIKAFHIIYSNFYNNWSFYIEKVEKVHCKAAYTFGSFHFRTEMVKQRCFSGLNQIANFHEKALFLCISYGPRSEKLLKKWTLEIYGARFISK